MKTFLLGAAAMVALVGGASSANAAQTFNLNGVKFTDGSSITGSFTTNDALTVISAFNIKTDGFLGPQTYSSLNGDGASLSTSSISFIDYSFPFSQYLNLNLGKALSSTGALITGGSESYFIFSQSVARGGSVVAATAAVPEPATWALMILGMGAVGFAMRRRGQVKTTVRFA